MQIVSNAAAVASTSVPGSGYDVAISIADSAALHTAQYLTAVAKLIKPGGNLQLQQPASAEVHIAQLCDVPCPRLPLTTAWCAQSGWAGLKHELLLSGFTDVQPVGSVPGLLILRATLPTWGLGGKAALPLKAKKDAPAAQPVAWNLAADDGDEELVDDDELLTAEDLKRPAPAAKADDCEVGAGRKACANCSCGRAEAEAAGKPVQLTQEMLDNPQSSCGNCSLGDAFRCASCPYKGLPAFEPGKKIQLPSSFLAADV